MKLRQQGTVHAHALRAWQHAGQRAQGAARSCWAGPCVCTQHMSANPADSTMRCMLALSKQPGGVVVGVCCWRRLSHAIVVATRLISPPDGAVALLPPPE